MRQHTIVKSQLMTSKQKVMIDTKYVWVIKVLKRNRTNYHIMDLVIRSPSGVAHAPTGLRVRPQFHQGLEDQTGINK